MFRLYNCRHCRVEDCKFRDKEKKGVALKIEGEKTKNIVVDGCHLKLIFDSLLYARSAGSNEELLASWAVFHIEWAFTLQKLNVTRKSLP